MALALNEFVMIESFYGSKTGLSPCSYNFLMKVSSEAVQCKKVIG